MALVTRTWKLDQEQSLQLKPGTGNQGNGQDLHSPVGASNVPVVGTIFRDLMHFSLSWGVTQTKPAVKRNVSSRLYMLCTSGLHINGKGSDPYVSVRRLDGPFVHGGGDEGNWALAANIAGTAYPGPNLIGVNITKKLTGAGTDNWIWVDITDIVDDWSPDTVIRSDGAPGTAAPNHGLSLRGRTETDTISPDYRFEIFSARAVDAKRAYIEHTYDANESPLPPTITSPVGDVDPATITSPSGKEDTTSFSFNDPNGGDKCAMVQIQYFDYTALDGATGNAIKDVTVVPVFDSGIQYHYKVTGLPDRTAQPNGMRKRLRTKDDSGSVDTAWGEWSPLATGYIKTAYQPGVPTNPVFQTTPDDPHIGGTLNSADPNDVLTAWEGEVWRDTQLGRVNMWPDTPGSAIVQLGGGTRSDVVYGGAPLVDGMQLNWRHRHYGRDGAVGLWSPTYSVTMQTAVGPSITPSDVSTKLLSRTAQITLTFQESSDGYQYNLYRNGVLIYPGVVTTIGAAGSVNVNLPTGLVNWGDTLEIEAASRPAGTGVMGPFSPRSSLHVTAIPTTTLGIANASLVGGVLYFTGADPTYNVPYITPERTAYGETATAREWEIRQAATPAGSGTLVKFINETSGILDADTLGAAFVPTNGTTYDIRARYRNNADFLFGTTMAAASSAAAMNVKLTAVAGLTVGMYLTLEPGTADAESRLVTAVGTAGSGGTGVTVSPGYTLAHSNGDTARAYPWGPWTAWATAKRTTAPTVGLNTPAQGAIIQDPTPNLTHLYSSSKPQSRWELFVWKLARPVPGLARAARASYGWRVRAVSAASTVQPGAAIAGRPTYGWAARAVLATSSAQPASAHPARASYGWAARSVTRGGPRIISGPAAYNLGTSGAQIDWALDQPATGQVEWATHAQYLLIADPLASTPWPNATARESSFDYSQHSQTISGAPASTRVHFRVRSSGMTGIETISAPDEFTTLAGAGTGPTVGVRATPANLAALNYPVTLAGDEPGGITNVVSWRPTTGTVRATIAPGTAEATIKSTIANVPNGTINDPSIVVFQPGTYNLASKILVGYPSKSYIIFWCYGAVFNCSAQDDRSWFMFDGPSGTMNHHIKILGGEVAGTHTTWNNTTAYGRDGGIAIGLYGVCEDFEIADTSIHHTWSDAVMITGDAQSYTKARRVAIHHNKFEKNGRNWVTPDQGEDVWICWNQMIDSAMFGMDIEDARHANQVMNGFRIRDNIFDGWAWAKSPPGTFGNTYFDQFGIGLVNTSLAGSQMTAADWDIARNTFLRGSMGWGDTPGNDPATTDPYYCHRWNQVISAGMPPGGAIGNIPKTNFRIRDNDASQIPSYKRCSVGITVTQCNGVTITGNNFPGFRIYFGQNTGTIVHSGNTAAIESATYP